MQHNRNEEILLLDFYGDLLTKHQRDILGEYYNEDFSMNEIADNYNISKSAVQDLIKRSLLQLKNYEKVLKLIENNKKLDEIINEMENENNILLNKYIKKLNKIK